MRNDTELHRESTEIHRVFCVFEIEKHGEFFINFSVRAV